MDYEQTSLIYRNLGQEKKFQEKPENIRYKKEQAFISRVILYRNDKTNLLTK